MNKTEQKAFKWLKKQGYKANEIIFREKDTPDFLCSDKKRYEVKFLYGKRIIFNSTQIVKMKAEDEVLVFDRDKFIIKFKWKNKDNLAIDIHVIQANPNPKIPVTQEVKEELDTIKTHPRETYNDVVQRLLHLNYEKEVKNGK